MKNGKIKYLIAFLATVFVLVALRVVMPNFLSNGDEKIIANVSSVSFSAKIIRLKHSVGGFSVVVIIPATKIVFSGGETATLKDLISGERIQAVGRPGDRGALLAEKVVVFR